MKPVKGRPTLKSNKIIDDFLNRVMDGESIEDICKDNKMPSKTSIMKWLREDDDFAHQYARAKEVLAHLYNEQNIKIADAAKTRVDAEVAKVRIQARQWAASKLNPKKYGDKLQADITHKILPPPKWIDESL